MINYYYRSIRDKQLHKQNKQRKGSWIFVHSPNTETIETLITKHGYDQDILEDATDYFEVPRLEHENGVNYLFTRYPVNTKDGELSTAPILIALSEDFVLTLTHHKAEFLDDIAHNRTPDMITTQRVRFVLKLLLEVTSQYHKSLMTIRREMLRYFGNFDRISEQDIEHFVGLESTIADYISALSPTQYALRQMLASSHITLHADDADEVQDLTQDVTQLLESARMIGNNIQNIRNAHSAILANKLNKTMKALTAVTIMLTVPTIVASIFGMNTWLPFGDGASSFIVILGIIVVSFSLVGLWFYRKDWFTF